jgi:hypothetical protein
VVAALRQVEVCLEVKVQGKAVADQKAAEGAWENLVGAAARESEPV